MMRDMVRWERTRTMGILSVVTRWLMIGFASACMRGQTAPARGAGAHLTPFSSDRALASFLETLAPPVGTRAGMASCETAKIAVKHLRKSGTAQSTTEPTVF